MPGLHGRKPYAAGQKFGVNSAHTSAARRPLPVRVRAQRPFPNCTAFCQVKKRPQIQARGPCCIQRQIIVHSPQYNRVHTDGYAASRSPPKPPSTNLSILISVIIPMLLEKYCQTCEQSLRHKNGKKLDDNTWIGRGLTSYILEFRAEPNRRYKKARTPGQRKRRPGALHHAKEGRLPIGAKHAKRRQRMRCTYTATGRRVTCQCGEGRPEYRLPAVDRYCYSSTFHSVNRFFRHA